MEKQTKAVTTNSINEKLDISQIVLRHMESLGQLIIKPDVPINSYTLGIEHLSSMMNPMKDDKFRMEMSEKRTELGMNNLSLSGIISERNQGLMKSRQRDKNRKYYQALFTSLQDLSSRVGIGWTRTDIGDFEGYYKHLLGEMPSNYQEEYGIKIMQEIRATIWEENKNFLGLTIGPVGTGKSLSAISMSMMLDRTFNLKRVVFSEKEFLALINSNLPKGAFIVCDETGAWFGNRDYMSSVNKLLSTVVQTFRNKNLGLFWTVPHKRQVDLNVRCMANMEIETVTLWKDVKPGRCMVKVKHIKPNVSGAGKELQTFPVYHMEEGTVKITRCLIPKPDNAFEKRYEDKKKKWQKVMYAEMSELIDHEKSKALGRLKPKVTKKDLIVKDLKVGMKHTDIARKHRTSAAYVREISYVN